MNFIFSTIIRFDLFAKMLLASCMVLPLEAASKKMLKKQVVLKKKKTLVKPAVLKKIPPVSSSTLLDQLDKATLNVDEKQAAAFLKQWYRATLSSTSPDTASLSQRLSFIKNNPSCPLSSKIKKTAEEQLFESATDKELSNYFETNSAQTLAGKIYVAAYKNGNKKALFLDDESLDAQDLSKVYARFKEDLKTVFHQKIDRLLSAQDYKKAVSLATVCQESLTAIELKRIKMLENPSNTSSQETLQDLEKSFDPGLLLTFLQTFRKQSEEASNTTTLLQIFSTFQDKIQAHEQQNPQSWWLERHILSRRLLEQKDYQRAADLLESSFIKDKETYFHAKWMKAWIFIQFLKKPEQAREILVPLFEKAGSPITKARMGYWLYKSYSPSSEEGNKWLLKTREHPFTFYGQKVTKSPLSFLKDDSPPSKLSSHLYAKVIKLLAKLGKPSMMESFLIALVQEASSQKDQEYVLSLAKIYGDSHLVVKVSKKTTLSTLPKEAFPTPYSVLRTSNHCLNFKALCYAIMRQESRFDPKALSPAGAKGLMQMMEPTAVATAKKWNVRYQNLFSPEHNIELGSAHVQDLLDYYKGDWVLSVAAYNAGKRAVDSWIEKYGDPRTLNHHEDFIELIPYGETRNYVQRVGENFKVYETLL
ncbi:MAG TPA: lytic transglycosylase domain-containing protein [Alphaproteobacteria bacterium]|nr:lytic transglycosylase domain-containing protein [Alphaproteobacteria bacterium]